MGSIDSTSGPPVLVLCKVYRGRSGDWWVVGWGGGSGKRLGVKGKDGWRVKRCVEGRDRARGGVAGRRNSDVRSN